MLVKVTSDHLLTLIGQQNFVQASRGHPRKGGNLLLLSWKNVPSSPSIPALWGSWAQNPLVPAALAEGKRRFRPDVGALGLHLPMPSNWPGCRDTVLGGQRLDLKRGMRGRESHQGVHGIAKSVLGRPRAGGARLPPPKVAAQRERWKVQRAIGVGISGRLFGKKKD